MIPHWALYLIGGFLTGSINSIAGGGALLLFPLLVGAGVPAVMANTTMSLAVLPGSVSSAYGYRKQLRKLPKRYFMLLIPCFIGSLSGAVLLLDTSGRTFRLIAPIFMIAAITLLILQPRIYRRLYRKKATRQPHFSLECLIGLVFLVLSAYGGYFGAGFGIIVLSLLSLTRINDIQKMNGLKNSIGISVGIADSAYFIHRHVVDWHVLPMLVIGGLLGGYITSTYGSKLPAAKLRIAIIFMAVGVTVYLCYKFYAWPSQAQAQLRSAILYLRWACITYR